MKSVGGVALAVVILLAMVTIHEFGHYLAGKILGFRINEFAVGFGPALFKKRNRKTGELFALRLIPLGGYCAFDGEDEESDDGDKTDGADGGEKGTDDGETAEPFADCSAPAGEAGKGGNEEPESVQEAESGSESGEQPIVAGKRFNDQPPWKRIIVLVAGATMNYLLALVLIVIMFACIGRPHSYVWATPSETEESVSAAEEAEDGDFLQAGDVILSVNGRKIYLFTDYSGALRGKKAGDCVPVVVLRKNEEGNRVERTLSVELRADADFANMSDTGTIYAVFGLNPEECRVVNVIMKHGFFESLGDSFVYSGKIGGMVLRSLGELLTGKIGLDSMGGPVTTIKVTSEAASAGPFSFLNIAAFIGVNLAVFNLLPIPALDGSKVVFCVIEWIRKKPINRKVEAMIHFIGIIFLFGFAILVDLLHLFV